MSETLRISVRLTPKASQNKISGWAKGPEGEDILKASVTAVPEKGKANKALIGLLAKECGLPKSCISIVRGETDRNKIIEISNLDVIPPLLTPP